MKGIHIINRALTPDEVKKMYEAGPPQVQKKKITFSEWLASGVYKVPSSDSAHPELFISREILIKRIANILGASHPQGTKQSEEAENKFDPYVKELHMLNIANGYPATYYQLLEIAKGILQTIKVLFDS